YCLSDDSPVFVLLSMQPLTALGAARTAHASAKQSPAPLMNRGGGPRDLGLERADEMRDDKALVAGAVVAVRAHHGARDGAQGRYQGTDDHHVGEPLIAGVPGGHVDQGVGQPRPGAGSVMIWLGTGLRHRAPLYTGVVVFVNADMSG